MTISRRYPIPWLALPLMVAWAAPACAALGGASDDGPPLWRVVGALLLCLALAVAGAFALRARLGRTSIIGRLGVSGRRLRVEESLRVTTQLQVAIIRCDDQEMLIAATSSGPPLLIPLAAVAKP